MAHELLELLLRRGWLPAGAGTDRPFPAEEFHTYRARVREAFEVPETSVTPMLARFLFGLAMLLRPREVWGLGTYAGNAIVWLAAHQVLHGEPGRTIAIDISPAATELARGNFDRLGAGSVRARTADALSCTIDTAAVDLLYLDIDDPVSRKRGYLACLRRFLPYLAPHAVVIAHDACEPLFEADLNAYRAALAGEPRILRSSTVPLDRYGVEISVAGPAPTGGGTP